MKTGYLTQAAYTYYNDCAALGNSIPEDGLQVVSPSSWLFCIIGPLRARVRGRASVLVAAIDCPAESGLTSEQRRL